MNVTVPFAVGSPTAASEYTLWARFNVATAVTPEAACSVVKTATKETIPDVVVRPLIVGITILAFSSVFCLVVLAFVVIAKSESVGSKTSVLKSEGFVAVVGFGMLHGFASSSEADVLPPAMHASSFFDQPHPGIVQSTAQLISLQSNPGSAVSIKKANDPSIF